MTQCVTCPDCGDPMAFKEGMFGPYFRCTKYPKCKGSHKSTSDGRPVGVPVPKATRKLRQIIMDRMKHFMAYPPKPVAQMNHDECEQFLSELEIYDIDELGWSGDVLDGKPKR